MWSVKIQIMHVEYMYVRYLMAQCTVTIILILYDHFMASYLKAPNATHTNTVVIEMVIPIPQTLVRHKHTNSQCTTTIQFSFANFFLKANLN